MLMPESGGETDPDSPVDLSSLTIAVATAVFAAHVAVKTTRLNFEIFDMMRLPLR
jgi:hypothetical protein